MPAEVKSVTDLASRLRGRLVTPDDDDYDRAKVVFYGGIDKTPAAIAQVADSGDVAIVVSYARDSGLELAIRSGGHSFAGHSLSHGGIVLDVRNLRGLEIDTGSRTAWAEAGVTAGEYTDAAGEFGLATGFGDTGSVGISGLTLGGGVGFLVRKFGLTIDDLLAAEMVTADGQHIRVDNENHQDLFWAIRGGGGNFGVVTRFQFRLHELPSIYGGVLILPATAEIIADFAAEAEAASEELSAIANVMPAPPMPMVPEDIHGELVVFALMVYAGDPAAGEQALAPFRRLAAPHADLLQAMKYAEIFQAVEGSEEYHPTAVARTMLLDKFDLGVAGDIMEQLQASSAPMRVTQLRVLGGAAARVPADATAYAHRASKIMANLAAFYQDDEDRARQEKWVSTFESALRQDDNGVYVNFLGAEGQDQIRRAYPNRTWDRLVEVKTRYDPENFFRMNQNIPPRA